MSTRERVRKNGGRIATKDAGRKTRSDRIRHAIERDIVSGKLLPGTKLDEDALASRHGASRTPVREALQQLASQGLIRLIERDRSLLPYAAYRTGLAGLILWKTRKNQPRR